jgi:hypothetical protein
LQVPFTHCVVGGVTVRGREAKAHFVVSVNPKDTSPVPGQGPRLLEEARRHEGKEGYVLLEMEDGRWRVRGVAAPAGPGAPATLHDFAALRPSPEIQRLLDEITRQQQIVQNHPAFDALGALDAEGFEALWRTDCEARDEPARDVLRRLLGVNLVESFPGVKEAVGKRVSVNLKGKSRLEVVEEVCRLAGVLPRYQAGVVLLEAGPRPKPVAFAGPFLLEVGGVEEFPEYARGTLTLHCFAAGLPPAFPLGPAPATYRLWGVRATGPEGTDLHRGGAAALALVPTSGLVRANAGAVTELFTTRATLRVPPALSLRNLLSDVDRIVWLSGRVRVTLLKADVFRFDSLQAGAVREHQQMRWEVLRDGAGAVSLKGTGVAGRFPAWMAYDDAGKPMRFGTATPARDGPLVMALPAGARSVILKVLGAGTHIDYEFSFRDIRLKQRPPRRLEPALFPGKEAPASVRIEEPAGGMPSPDKPVRVVLRIENHCQKDIEKVRLKLLYRDGAGKVLREVGRSATTPDPKTGGAVRPQALVRAGESATSVLNEPAPPAGTVRLEARLTAVEFMDAQTWTP